jgi:hypothetical protein
MPVSAEGSLGSQPGYGRGLSRARPAALDEILGASARN